MEQIAANKSLKLKNVLSFRKKMAEPEININLGKIIEFFKENGLRQNGPIITSAHSTEMKNGKPVFDMEILVTMDRKFNLQNEYKFKEVFNLNYAVCAKHKGSVDTLQSTYDKLLEYVKLNNLQIITPVYTVYFKDLTSNTSEKSIVIEIYVGVNPSVL